MTFSSVHLLFPYINMNMRRRVYERATFLLIRVLPIIGTVVSEVTNSLSYFSHIRRHVHPPPSPPVHLQACVHAIADPRPHFSSFVPCASALDPGGDRKS